MLRIKKMYIGMNYVNGEFLPNRPDFSVSSPATGEHLGEYPLSSSGEVSDAVSVAKQAFKSWKHVSRVNRADLFDRLAQLVKRDAEALAEVISHETGKNRNESYAEVIESLHMCQYVAGSGRLPYGDVVSSELSSKLARVFRKPKGVVAVISPWNFPLAIGSFWSAAPAIAEGNCVVHKPSELTPMTAQKVAQLYNEAGFPDGVYNLIHGAEETGKNLVSHHDVSCILFTGSAEVGQEIRKHCATTWHKTCSCEMGSKSATMVFEDGNFDLAIEVSVASAFKLSGQRCVSSGRILIQRSIYDKFCSAFVEAASQLSTGDVFSDEDVYYGPLISSDALKKVESYNSQVRSASDSSEDVKVLLGVADVLRQEMIGNFLSPFVYQAEWWNHVDELGCKACTRPYLKEEVFGPHVALIPFDDLNDAIKIYNDTPYGLALGAVTDDFRKHRILEEECNTGMLYINGGSIAAESHLPFGGIGKSGNGWKSAAGTYQAVTEEISVTTNYEEEVAWAQGMKS
jgi:aldehyde dehydrogenase (NAD+)